MTRMSRRVSAGTAGQGDVATEIANASLPLRPLHHHATPGRTDPRPAKTQENGGPVARATVTQYYAAECGSNTYEVQRALHTTSQGLRFWAHRARTTCNLRPRLG